MIRLELSPSPRWIDLLPGLRLQVAPITATMLARAQTAMPKVEPEIDPVSGEEKATGPDFVWQAMFDTEVAKRCIVGWEGVSSDSGDPLPVSPEAIAALMDIHPIHTLFRSLVMAPALLLAAEGNGSAPLPNGVSAGAQNTATTASAAAPNALS